MRIENKDFDENIFLSLLILSCIEGTATEEDKNAEILLTFNGREVDIRKYAKRIERGYKEILEAKAIELLEDFKEDYLLKNTGKLQFVKLKKQFEKANNQLKQIEEKMEMLIFYQKK